MNEPTNSEVNRRIVSLQMFLEKCWLTMEKILGRKAFTIKYKVYKKQLQNSKNFKMAVTFPKSWWCENCFQLIEFNVVYDTKRPYMQGSKLQIANAMRNGEGLQFIPYIIFFNIQFLSEGLQESRFW